MPLITRFVFASVPVANRSPWKCGGLACLPQAGRRFYAVLNARPLLRSTPLPALTP